MPIWYCLVAFVVSKGQLETTSAEEKLCLVDFAFLGVAVQERRPQHALRSDGCRGAFICQRSSQSTYPVSLSRVTSYWVTSCHHRLVSHTPISTVSLRAVCNPFQLLL